MAIQHKSYEHGKVQSLHAQDAQGRHFSIGLLMPGDYDFGLAEESEEISVTSGELHAMGGVFRSGSAVKFVSRSNIVVSCPEPTSYICYYG